MKVLMLTWEYPPRIVGGISRVVYDLAHAMSKKGIEVHVVTCAHPNAPEYEKDGNIYVYRVNTYDYVTANNFTDWALQLNFALAAKASELANKVKFDVIHAHDWLVAFAAKTVKQAFNIPLVATIHATEFGRNHGIKTAEQRYISNIEWFLTYEASKVICNSYYMQNEVNNIFQLPEGKTWVIHNGVDLDKFKGVNFDQDFRRRFALDNEKIVFFVGRLVHEKGVEALLDAVPKILRDYYDTKIVIGGKGPMMDEYKRKAYNMGIAHKVCFTGYLSDEDLLKLYKVSDIAVFPSLYEPFGIVALEGMVANVPTVVSDCCGLGEIIEHKVDGMKSLTGNPNSIADCILELLYHPDLCDYIRKNAAKKVKEKYNWDGISDLTIQVYKEVIKEHEAIATGKPIAVPSMKKEEKEEPANDEKKNKITKKAVVKKSTAKKKVTKKIVRKVVTPRKTTIKV